MPKNELFVIWARQKELTRGESTCDLGLADDERVEDAGLEEDEAPTALDTDKRKSRRRFAA